MSKSGQPEDAWGRELAPLSTDVSVNVGRRQSDATTLSPSIASAEEEEKTAKSAFLLRKRFTTLWSRKKSVQETGDFEEDQRGQFGLRLLHTSPEPLIELIFVHGLRGGSIKTWRKGEDYRLFWPKFFLPMDPDFRNASIYSFGYDSDWGSSKHSILSA